VPERTEGMGEVKAKLEKRSRRACTRTNVEVLLLDSTISINSFSESIF